MIASTTRKIVDVGSATVRTSIGTTREIADVIGSGIVKITRSYRDAGATVVGQTRSAAERAADQASDSVNTVVGQARSAAQRTADEVSKNAREVVGQVRAQGEATSERIEEIVERTGDRAVDIVEDKPAAGTPYEHWTKDELYERATELDIDERPSMNKKQLIAALRAA